MKEKLAEIVAKAARDQGNYQDLVLIYQRGHELSGITRFEMRADGEYSLATNNPRRQSADSFEGRLSPEQRASILGAADEARLLSIAPSSRPIGDDELPVVVELRHDDLQHRLLIWAGDAERSAAFSGFEQALWAVLREISGGKVGPGPV